MKQTQRTRPTVGAAVKQLLSEPLDPVRDKLRSELETARSTVRLKREIIREKVRGYADARHVLREAEAALDAHPAATTRDPELIARDLRRHRLCGRVLARRGTLYIETPPLFADIRTGDGERETQRRCIGAFDITLRLSSPSRLTIKQALYNVPTYQHWFVSSGGRACLGDAEEQLLDSLRSPRIGELLDLIYSYLTAASLDGAAYIPSHRWLERARNVNSAPVATASYAFIQDKLLITAGNSGRVRGETPDRVQVAWKQPLYRVNVPDPGYIPVDPESGYIPVGPDDENTQAERVDSVSWWVPREHVNITHPDTPRWDRLDALPDTATRGEAQAILAKITAQ